MSLFYRIGDLIELMKNTDFAANFCFSSECLPQSIKEFNLKLLLGDFDFFFFPLLYVRTKKNLCE